MSTTPPNISPGTIIVETAQRRLYYVLPDGQAVEYGIGVGRDGFRWSGEHAITRKGRVAGLDAAGADAPARAGICRPTCPVAPTIRWGPGALYIGATLYRLHGTSEPWTIGQAVSSGCIRLTNDDIIDLYTASRSARWSWVHQ